MKFLEKNESNADRIVRAVVGIVLLYVYLFQIKLIPGGMIVETIVALVGVIAVVTAATGSCCVYPFLGWNTLKKAKAAGKPAAKAKPKARAKKKRR
jgi:hypothetical protein